MGLIGPNGSGKTTMINCISGALFNDAGEIIFEGRDITTLPAHRRARLGIARSFQIPKPFRSMSVIENLYIPLEYAAWTRIDHGRVGEEAMDILERIGLADKALESGGEQQMIAFARALISAPRILLVDEPSVGLAPILVNRMIAKIRELKEERNLTILMAEQNFNQAIKIADRGYIIVYGEIVFEGRDPEEFKDNELVKRYYLGV